ncbi:hypothetical protein BU15DRAFT_61689 [Melanogaster broomeanus]|nr:hypothetical protein BU15DRAFT_61689 [Melanogaster broomeanus]
MDETKDVSGAKNAQLKSKTGKRVGVVEHVGSAGEYFEGSTPALRLCPKLHTCTQNGSPVLKTLTHAPNVSDNPYPPRLPLFDPNSLPVFSTALTLPAYFRPAVPPVHFWHHPLTGTFLISLSYPPIFSPASVFSAALTLPACFRPAGGIRTYRRHWQLAHEAASHHPAMWRCKAGLVNADATNGDPVDRSGVNLTTTTTM